MHCSFVCVIVTAIVIIIVSVVIVMIVKIINRKSEHRCVLYYIHIYIYIPNYTYTHGSHGIEMPRIRELNNGFPLETLQVAGFNQPTRRLSRLVGT